MSDTLLTTFRRVALLEGVSFLLLLGIAMPLKYYFDSPMAVRVVGSAHGLLFVLYVGLVLALFLGRRFTVLRVIEALVLSLLPFGTFVLDRKLRREQQACVTAP